MIFFVAHFAGCFSLLFFLGTSSGSCPYDPPLIDESRAPIIPQPPSGLYKSAIITKLARDPDAKGERRGVTPGTPHREYSPLRVRGRHPESIEGW